MFFLQDYSKYFPSLSEYQFLMASSNVRSPFYKQQSPVARYDDVPRGIAVYIFVESILPRLSPRSLISLENIPRINLVLHVVEYSIIAVGKDCAALRLEFFDVIDHD